MTYANRDADAAANELAEAVQTAKTAAADGEALHPRLVAIRKIAAKIV